MIIEKKNIHSRTPESVLVWPPAAINFDTPPAALDRYRFGGYITRENFTSFLISDFVRSRGSQTNQAYSWEWLRRHADPFIISKIKNFTSHGAFECLTDEEQDNLVKSFEGIRSHSSITSVRGETGWYLREQLGLQLEWITTILEKPNGGRIHFVPKPVFICRMDEYILSLEKEEFLRVLALKATSGLLQDAESYAKDHLRLKG